MVEFDIVVVGGGPGGYAAAIGGARRGARVCLVEQDQLGGTCLHRGCIPTKAYHGTARLLNRLRDAGEHGVHISGWSFDFGQAARRKDALVRRLASGLQQLVKGHRIDVFRGRASLEGPGRLAIRRQGVTGHVRARTVILATGSRAARPADLAIDGKNILTSEEILGIQELPESLLIVGGGYIGCEFAAIFAAFGCRVVLVEQQGSLLGGADAEAVAEITRNLKAQGVVLHTGTTLDELGEIDGAVVARLAGGEKVSAAKALVAVGRVANSGDLGLEELGVSIERGAVVVDDGMRTSLAGLYAVGDVTGGPQLAHVAVYQAGIAVENALGGDARVDYRILPSAVFTLPEMSQVGLTEADCRARGIEFKIGHFPYRTNAKALCDGEPGGFVKLVADRRDGTLLGGVIVGEEASVLIAEVAAAMGQGLTAAALADLIHAHPTLAEMVMESAADADSMALHRPPSSSGTDDCPE
jgi:dihydrolipoamide dehydrogenase